MAGLFGAPSAPFPQTPPPAPSLADDEVQQAAADSLKNRRGRASTMLTNPQTQRPTDRQTYLTGA